jgi:hypothetical protein
VPNVAGLINGRPAKINSDLAGMDRLERFFGFGKGVIDSDHDWLTVYSGQFTVFFV